MKQPYHVAIVFGREEKGLFNRFSFPILGRPVGLYPLMACLNTEMIDRVFLSSDSPALLNIGRAMESVTLIERKVSQETLTQEVRVALTSVEEQLGIVPDTVTILLANSPCINPGLIDDGVTFLEKNPSFDSAVTTMKRAEFSTRRMFLFDDRERFVRKAGEGQVSEDAYFLDKRVMTVRGGVIDGSTACSDYFEDLLGRNIHPMMQQEGIWDIDYIWQVPIVERWLRQNGFTEAATPYKKPAAGFGTGLRMSFRRLESVSDESKQYRVLITTVPFGEVDTAPLDLLRASKNISYVINPRGRKLKEDELAELIGDFDIVIAGTEQISRGVLGKALRLKLISRVGIGLDSVDLKAARERGIIVSYTPDAPSPAVAELTIAQMLNLLRKVPLVDRKIRSGIWQRIQGERLASMTVGIIGTGRVGSRVLKHLQGFNPKAILVNDLKPDDHLYDMYHAKCVDKETIFREADIITLHVPLTPLTRGLVTKEELGLMKRGALLINTSRGGIVNEVDLYEALTARRIGGAALDVFESEPYSGNLIELDNCLLTCHMGSMTNDCRAAMEINATEEVCRFVLGEPLKQVVPEEEYEMELLSR